VLLFCKGCFYWALLNISNHQKYTLTALQLYAVANVSRLRNQRSYKLFDNLFTNINKLYNVGLELNINGDRVKYYGLLAFGLGDTPALNWLGGFKESVSKAFKYCRVCEITSQKNMLNYVVVERDINIHKVRLEKMKKLNSDELKVSSKKYGINFPSLLLDIDHFNICKCLLQDPMHVLYEGICHLELRCLLNSVIFQTNLISLGILNEKIIKFKYCNKDKSDKPNIISESEYKNEGKFSQSAGQMSTLFQNLPLMIGDKLKNNRNWINFLRLLSIINLTYSICYDDRTVSELKREIKEYLETFSELYPEIRKIPKMHFLQHFPKQLVEFGPLGLHSTFRFEGKNGLLKSYDFNNFKNICKSVAYRQEYWMVSKRLDIDWKKNKNYLSKGIETKNFKNNVTDEGYSMKYEYIGELKECDRLSIEGFTYNLDDFILVRDNLDIKTEAVGMIKRILIINNSFCFKIRLYDIIEFNIESNSYNVRETDHLIYKYLRNIIHKETLNKFVIDLKVFIQIRKFFHKLS